MKLKLLAGLALIISLLTINITSVHAADLASVTLSSASAEVGKNFTVTVRENSGSTTINLVTAVLSYDSSKVQFVGFDDSNSEFDFKGAQSGGGGTVSVKRSLYGGAYTGTHTVVGVTFKALVGSGSTTISVADGTNVANPQTGGSPVWDGVHNSTGVALTTPVAATPAPTAPTTPGPTSSNNSTKKTAAASNNSTTAPAAAPEAEAPAGEVKSESDKKDEAKKEEKKDDKTADTSEKSSVWTGILVAIAAGFAFFAGRRYVAQRAANAKAKTAAAEQSKKHNKKSNK